jgi:hypothetical protein
MQGHTMLGRRAAIKAALAAAAWLCWPPRLRAAPLPASTEAALRDAERIYVATRRRNGALSSIEPIWFNYTDGKIFFSTAPDSWKAKRIAEGSPLYIWVGSPSGPFVEGRAEAVTDPAFIDRMGAAYSEKYWLAWLGLFRPRSSRVADGKTKAFLVTVTQAAPPPKP